MRQSVNTDYGVNLFAVQSGTGVNNGFVLGESDASDVDTIPVSASTTYSASVRVKGVISLILRTLKPEHAFYYKTLKTDQMFFHSY